MRAEELRELEWYRLFEEYFSPGGRGIPLLAELERALAEGKTRPVEEVCAEWSGKAPPSCSAPSR